MRNLRWMLFIGALTIAGCGGPVTDEEDSAVDESTPEATSDGDASRADPSAAATTCTQTFGPCRIGQCELGPRDHFQIVSVTCCNPNGACSTTNYRVCGC